MNKYSRIKIKGRSRAGRRSRGEPGFPELPGMVNDGP